MNSISKAFAGLVLALSVSSISTAADKKPVELLNVSYDVSRELFTQINPAFTAQWQQKTGQALEIKQSHAGSSAQARAVAEGLRADVVTLNQVTDIEFLRRSGYIAADWASRFPQGSSPYYSLPVFLVRPGNPKQIRDWDDLVKPGVQSVFPNPKTSGNGRYTYLGAYLYALEKNGGDKNAANDFVSRFVRTVPVFDTGGRGATITFVQRDIGDVLISFESEVNAIRRQYGPKAFEVVVPSVSVRADFPVAVVDKVVDRRGTRALATAYLQFQFSDEGQDILARNFNRVSNPTVAARYKSQFPDVRLLTVEEKLGSWEAATKTFFADGGLLDKALGVNR